MILALPLKPTEKYFWKLPYPHWFDSYACLLFVDLCEAAYEFVKSSRCICQYIIIKDGILRFNSFNITFKRGVYFTVHSLGSIRTNFQ